MYMIRTSEAYLWQVYGSAIGYTSLVLCASYTLLGTYTPFTFSHIS